MNRMGGSEARILTRTIKAPIDSPPPYPTPCLKESYVFLYYSSFIFPLPVHGKQKTELGKQGQISCMRD